MGLTPKHRTSVERHISNKQGKQSKHPTNKCSTSIGDSPCRSSVCPAKEPSYHTLWQGVVNACRAAPRNNSWRASVHCPALSQMATVAWHCSLLFNGFTNRSRCQVSGGQYLVGVAFRNSIQCRNSASAICTQQQTGDSSTLNATHERVGTVQRGNCNST